MQPALCTIFCLALQATVSAGAVSAWPGEWQRWPAAIIASAGCSADQGLHKQRQCLARQLITYGSR